MDNQVNPLENESDQLLSESIETFFKEDDTQEVSEPKEEVEEQATTEEPETKEEVIEEDSKEDESTEEVEDETEINEKEINLNEDLRGVFNKEYINLLESLEDSDLRDKFIEEGKKSRSELDRKRLELGETKKLVETVDEAIKANNLNYNRQDYGDLIKNFIGFDALYSKNPQLAIESLAKQANIDLNTLNIKPVPEVKDDLDDYRTPEEIRRDKEIETLRHDLNLIKNQTQQNEKISATQERDNFANAKDLDGNLKYPHFEKVRKDMALFFDDSDPSMTLEKAYGKAILLDSELIAKREEDILKGSELKRKADIERAKKLKRQSVRSSKVSASISNPEKQIENIVNEFYG